MLKREHVNNTNIYIYCVVSDHQVFLVSTIFVHSHGSFIDFSRNYFQTTLYYKNKFNGGESNVKITKKYVSFRRSMILME